MNYVAEDGQNLIHTWYEKQEDSVRAQFDATLAILRATEDWESPDVEEFKPLTKAHLGLGEIRFDIEAKAPGAKRPHKRRFRPVGIWPATKQQEFVLILGCEKYGRTFIPHAAFDLALEFKAKLEAGRGTICEHI